ncbi:nuclear pore complex protein Nup54-like [Limulus polyphemus]|uniref:Nuclear pore complex protein Nup54-like n=1 Tax=Limulus polyphemus TaxID=6850 RepID=A0ABM1BKE3_LIMPO|nr:nuclear pore complex protein Nup54-like [Limulus polyphemus]
MFGNLGSTGTSSVFGGLGSTGTAFGSGTGLFGSSNAGPATVTNIASALLLLMVYGDERDTILAKWNQLQAFWGTGKGYFSSNALPVDFTPENPFCRFKVISYSCLPTNKPEEGHVSLIINKKDTEVHSQQQHLVDSLHRLLGSKPTLSVCVEGVRALPDVRTEVIIYLIERAPTGLSRRVPTHELQAFLEQNHIKTHLNSMGILSCVPRSAPTKDQLKEYLDNPPAGIDPLLWQQAKMDNPDPDHLIPVPMIGFTELHRRIKAQEQETKQHQERLDIIAEDISKLQQRHSTTLAKIADHKRKQLELGHRILKVIVCQEISRKLGFAIQADEEQLRVQLEALQAELNAPTQFKGRLNELISQLRMQNHQVSAYRETSHYTLDLTLQEEIKQHLRYQQDGISHLISVLKDNMEDLKIIEEGLKEASDRRR